MPLSDLHPDDAEDRRQNLYNEIADHERELDRRARYTPVDERDEEGGR